MGGVLEKALMNELNNMKIDRSKLPNPRQERKPAPERTGWRDQNLSERHRQWGLTCPAVDIDLLLIEMDRAKACAIIEYKGELARPQLPSHPTYLALTDLGNRAQMPVFAVRYAHDFSWFRIIPLNFYAKKTLPERHMMDERQFITFLYNLRGVQPPQQLFNLLETAI